MDSYFDQQQRNNSRWRTPAALGALAYAVLVAAALFTSVPAARGLAGGGHTMVALGPFHFIDIQKTAHTGGGYELNFSLKIGLLLFLVCVYGFVALGLLWKSRARR